MPACTSERRLPFPDGNTQEKPILPGRNQKPCSVHINYSFLLQGIAPLTVVAMSSKLLQDAKVARPTAKQNMLIHASFQGSTCVAGVCKSHLKTRKCVLVSAAKSGRLSCDAGDPHVWRCANRSQWQSHPEGCWALVEKRNQEALQGCRREVH